jgi:putative membrane protein
VTWTFEPVTIGLLTLSVGLYARGVHAARRHSAGTQPFSWWQVAAFGAAIASLALALISPLDWLSDILFSAHMTQHEILMLVAAPLLVVGQPLLAFLWVVPASRRRLVAGYFRRPAVARSWRVLTGPVTVFVVHGIALWIWHVPALFEAALGHEGIHAVQHLSFLLTAALFWWAMIHGRYGRAGYGAAVAYVFLTSLHSTILGALLTISPTTWYRSYEATAAGHHIDALADQQLAGLVMWVPSGVVFIVVGLALFAAWLGESERRVALGSTAASAGTQRVSDAT